MPFLNIVVQATARTVEIYWHSKMLDEVRWKASIFLLISGIAHKPSNPSHCCVLCSR